MNERPDNGATNIFHYYLTLLYFIYINLRCIHCYGASIYNSHLSKGEPLLILRRAFGQNG
jgi:hypothetical protein